MDNPVRIYVLHHPSSIIARQLTGYIYNWFRLTNLEGVPVYLRSEPAPSQLLPLPPSGGKGVLEYLIPLVDAYMVRDVSWHDYLLDLAEKCVKPSDNGKLLGEGCVMLPVALDGTAFNLPGKIGQRNFIRHSIPAGNWSTEEQKKTAFQDAAQETLKHLTEALGRDLNGRLFPTQAGRKLKIFISYARADGADTPRRLRDYIQGHTQCSAFFDENDISFGESFSDALEEGAGEEARALIVVCGNHYADRPWCRWEISRFMHPSKIFLDPADQNGTAIQMFHPVLVLDAMETARMSRIIPELGQVPVMRWAPGRELQAFSTLIRELLFGARNVLAARSLAQNGALDVGPVVNRLPGPVNLQRLLSQHPGGTAKKKSRICLSYPGNGLPLMELRLLESLFEDVRLTAFRDVTLNVPESMQQSMQKSDRPLSRKVLAISYSAPSRLGSLGYLPQHLEEAVIYLLRPVLRLGADLVYGGRAPKRDADPGLGAVADPSSTRNMTLTLMNLLNDERSAGEFGLQSGVSKTRSPCRSRLYNISPWPACTKITAEDEAAWINTCSIVRVLPKDAGLNGRDPDATKELQRHVFFQSVVLTRMRRMLAGGFTCKIPGDGSRRVKPDAFILIGGKLEGFSGRMPGIMEEFLRAAQEGSAIYLIGGVGGAAGEIANALLSNGRKKPQAFSASFYATPETPNYRILLNALDKLGKDRFPSPEADFEELWKVIQTGRKQGITELTKNGLSERENVELLTTTDTMRAVHLVWQGLTELFLDPK